MLYQHLSSGIKFDWNFDDLEGKLGPDKYMGENIPSDMYDDISCSYFHTFYSKVGTSTNFSLFFIPESQHIVDKLKELQDKVREDVSKGLVERTELVDLFLEKNILLKDVLFLRMDAGVGATPHVDRRRSKALNIGFQNTCTCTTYFKEGKDFSDFYGDVSKLKAITMNDGDAYLVDVSQAHAVKANFPELAGTQRYIISLNLSKS